MALHECGPLARTFCLQVHGGRARFAMAAAGPTIQGTKYVWTLAVESECCLPSGGE